MATRLKPTRINVDNTPRVGDGAAYQNDNDFHWSMGGGDMSYRDFEWHTLTGTSLVIEDISNNITPSSDFTVSAGTELKPGIEYVLRVNTGNTPYTMTLGTGVTNPNSYKTELKPNTVNQFKFIATATNQLELEGVDSAVVSEINWGEIDGTLSDQTDLQNALDQKLDKVTSTATNPRAYVANADGSQATLPITDSATSGAIVRRNGTQITVPATPSTNTDAASKKYVDDQVSEATAGAVSDTAYGNSWDGVTGIAPSKNVVYDKISTMDTAISGNTTNINTINSKIPSEASATNQLADKDYVGDSINSVTAYYITKNANGDQFATYAELAAATTFYSGGVARVPTKNDYTIVLDDENHDHATTRYIYNNGWEYQYTVNETALTQAQLNAINSGITAAKVTQYDGYATSKQDKLENQTNIKSINNNSLLGSGNLTLNDVKVSATAPSSPTEGMVWYDTTNDQLKIYDGTNWNLSEASGVSTTQPANPVVGNAYYDTTNNALMIYDGTQWVAAGAVTSVNGQTGAVTVNEVPSTGTTGNVLTKTASGYEFAAPAASGIISDPNSPITIEKMRAGSTAQYSSATKATGVIYNVYE